MEHQPVEARPAATPYTGVERRRRPPVFGLRFRDFDVEQSALHMLTTQRTAAQGVGLFATPNIQHIALARRDPEFAAAMRQAQLVVCDGFPVYWYAQTRGQDLPGRITGREVLERIFAEPERLNGHRLFMVLDSEATAAAVQAWADEQSSAIAIETVIPPFGFEDDAAYCTDLAGRIAAFGTTLLFLAVGAPRSEVFVYRHQAVLPPCWALCVGQSFKVVLGLVAPPPELLVTLNLEWFWRILLEPRRMLRRYSSVILGFCVSILDDLRAARARRRR